MRNRFLKDTSPSVKIALVYLAFGIVWILLSDYVVRQLTNDVEITEHLQNFKGLLFVFSSGLLLYLTSRHFYRRINHTLHEKEKALSKLTALNEAANEALVDYDFATDTAVINEPMRRFLSEDSTRIANFSEQQQALLHPDDRERVLTNFREFLQHNASVWQAEFRFRNLQGVYRDMISRGYLIRDAKTQKPQYMVYALQDVTDIKEVNLRFYRQQLEHRQHLALSVLEAQESEKNRWAEELHDNVCQVLTVARLYIEHAGAGAGKTPELDTAQEMVEKALNDIRQLSALIKPPEFSTRSLHEAVETLLSNVQRFSRTEFSLALALDLEVLLPEEQKILVYRVIQEQVNNVMKYAQATQVVVAAELAEGAVRLRIKDNGKGFEPEKIKTGIGLKNIQSRLQFYAGDLTIRSAPGEGCELIARFDVAETPTAAEKVEA